MRAQILKGNARRFCAGHFAGQDKMKVYPNRYISMGPRKAGRRRCAVQVFSPEAKTLAQPELTSGEH